NYRKVLTDCAKAIKLKPQNIKAFYHSAKALYVLDKIDQALDCCEHGIEEILNQKAKIEEEHERKEREKKEALEKVIKESDFIEAFNEGNTFLEHLEVIFEQPAPWNIERLSYPKYVVKNDIPSFIILQQEKFQEEFLAKYKKVNE
ncbi:17277_t:CDS:2, partial [Dentiscutata erythropus]